MEWGIYYYYYSHKLLKSISSCELLSAGVDNTFRLFNFALEAQNRELTQKPMLKKLGIQRRHEKLPSIIGKLLFINFKYHY